MKKQRTKQVMRQLKANHTNLQKRSKISCGKRKLQAANNLKRKGQDRVNESNESKEGFQPATYFVNVKSGSNKILKQSCLD